MRKSTMKKSVSVLLTAAMTAGMLAGCGGSETTTNDAADNSAADKNTTATTEAAASDESTGGSYTDYSAGFPETVTIQIPVYDRAFEGWNVTDNYYTQWIQSEFGDKYNVNVEYVAIGRSTEVQDYMQLIAQAMHRTSFSNYDMPQAVNYYGEGAMQALDLDEIAYYAPTYYANMADTIEKYGKIDDENIFFFCRA